MQCQRVVARRDQHRLEAVHRLVAEVGRDVEHRAHRQVDPVRTQQVEAAGAGDVVQRQPHLRMGGAEGFDDPRQQIEDGRAAGGDIELAGVEAADLLPEHRIQPVQALDQRPRQLVELLALAGQGDPAPAALEQPHPQFPLQRLQLQGDRRLAQVQRLSRA